MEHVVALIRLDCASDGALVTVSGPPFERDQYSRMKHGSLLCARKMGDQLGTAILAAVPEIIADAAPLVTLHSYQYVPTSATYMAHAVRAQIDRARQEMGLEPTRPVRVTTSRVLREDYASLDQPGRLEHIQKLGYSLQPAQVMGANVLQIDDIRITGAGHEVVRGLLKETEHLHSVVAYYAIMDEAKGKADPGVESRINRTTIETLEDLIHIIEHDGMGLTIRVLKMVLAEADHDRLRDFLHAIPPQLLREMVDGASNSGPEFLEEHAPGFAVMRSVASEAFPELADS